MDHWIRIAGLVFTQAIRRSLDVRMPVLARLCGVIAYAENWVDRRTVAKPAAKHDVLKCSFTGCSPFFRR